MSEALVWLFVLWAGGCRRCRGSRSQGGPWSQRFRAGL